MTSITINVPEEILKQRTAEDFAQQMQLAAAIYLYSRGEITMGTAAQLAGTNIPEFLDILANEKIDVFQVDFDQLEQEIARA